MTWTVFFSVTIRTSDAERRAERERIRQRRERVQVAADDQDRHGDPFTAGTGGGRRDDGQSRQMSYGCEKPLIVSHSDAANGWNASGAPANDSSRG